MHRTNLLAALLCLGAACSQGPTGLQGPQGPAGPQGPGGPSGTLPRSFKFLDYGAQPDQASFDKTSNFQSAIDAAADAGTFRWPA